MVKPLGSWTVGVIGSGTHEHEALSSGVGQLLARRGANLLTGGGPGVMRAVSRAFVESPRERGIAIGIIHCASEAQRAVPKEGYPNEYVELAIYTHLPYSGQRGRDPLSRNHINILSSHAVVALPGEFGTQSEVSLALEYGRPIVAYATDQSLIERFPAVVPRAATLADVERFLDRHLV